MKKILVIGGGITGICSALNAAKAGYEVTIVEKTDSLGGYSAKLRKQLPITYPYTDIISPIIQSKIEKVEANPNITVKTETVAARIAGQPGEFIVTFKKPDENIEFDVPYPLPDEELRSIKVPTLLILGDKEIIYESGAEGTIKRAEELIENIQTKLIPDTSHMVNGEQSEQVNLHILSFLQE